jgi:WD40 repeat protein
MAVEPSRAKAIFLEAVDKAALDERGAFVEQACANDAELRQRVQALLQAHEAALDVLDRPAAEQFSAPSPGKGSIPVFDPQPPTPETVNTPGDLPPGAGDEALAVLSPPGRPGSLGRLGHYEMLDLLGQGGFGTVFKSFDEKLHRIVAIKVLAPALAASGTARQRFLREARAAAAVRDEHVIDIHAVEEQPVPYLVMEYVEGQTLQQKLEKTGPLPVKKILRIGYQVAAGLAAAHKQGLIHRDVKPSNILLENGVERVKLSDFGLARAVDDASLTQSGLVAGTPMYMSPEQAEARQVDHRSDLFSLGSVLYALCTGHSPFRAGSTLAVLKRVCEDTPRAVREVNADVPDWLAAVVSKLLAKEPGDRYQTAREVADVLAGFLSELQMHGQVLPERRAGSAPGAARAGTGGKDDQRKPTGEPTELTAAAGGNRPGLRTPRLLAALAVGVAGVVTAILVLREYWPASGDGPAPDGGAGGRSPNPLDRRSRKDVAPHLLALAGGGDLDRAPRELVALLGDGRFPLTGDRIGGMATSPDGRLLAAPCVGRLFLFRTKNGQLVRQFAANDHQIVRTAFSADGKRLLAASVDGTARLWSVATGRLLQTYRGHTTHVLAAIFGPGGKTVITGSADSSVRVWDAASGVQRHVLPHPDHVHGLALSPDGKRLATGCNDGGVRLWDLDSGELRETLPGHGGAVSAVAFTPDGKWLVTGSDDEVRIWDARTLQGVHTLAAGGSWLGLGPGGRTLLAARSLHRDGEAYVVTRWEVATGKQLPRVTLKSRGGWGVFALTPDGKTLLAARATPSPDLYVRSYDAESGRELFAAPRGHAGPVGTVAFSPDGKLLASAGQDRTVRLWDLAGWRRGEPLPPVRALTGHSQPVGSVKFSPDGKLLASGSLDRTIVLWDVAGGKKARTLNGHSNAPSRIAFSPDGRTLAAGHDDGTVKFWDVATGHLRSILPGHAGAVRCVAYSPDGRLLAAGGVDKTVQVFETDGERPVQQFTLPNVIDTVAFSDDGKLLAATADNTTDFNDPSTFYFWEVATWKPATFPSHPSRASGLAFCPAGPLAATAGHDRLVRFWDLRESTPRILTFGPGLFGAAAGEIAFTPDGRHWATANQNGTVAILKVPALPPAYRAGPPRRVPDARKLAGRPSAADALDPRAIAPRLRAQAGGGDPARAPAGLVAVLGGPDGHTGQVRGVAISPDGKRLASGGEDRVVRIWGLSTGRRLRVLAGHREPIHSVAFSPDNRTLASAGVDGTVRLWDAVTGKELHTLPATEWFIFHVAFSPDGKTVAAGMQRGAVNLWEVRTGRLLRAFSAGAGNCWTVAFSPDGRTLASGHQDGLIRLWDVATGWQRATTGLHPGGVRHLHFHPDGRTLIACAGPSLQLWDLATLKERQRLEGHAGVVLCCAVRADGGLVASAGETDGTLRLWDLSADQTPRRKVPLFPPDTRSVRGVAFTPDGRYLATANPDGTIYLLKLADKGDVFHVGAPDRRAAG